MRFTIFSAAKRVALLFLLSSFFVVALIAQNTSRIEGRVEDPAGAVVPNAAITAVNNKTHATLSTSSTKEGLYAFPSVDPGVYTLTVTATGFSKEVVNNVPVNVAATTTQTLQLKVGGVETSVTVEANAVAVQTTDSQLGSSVTMRDIDTLPQLGRTPITLAAYQPGVQVTANDVTFSHVNGLRQGSNNARLDGIDVNDAVTARLGLSLTANNTDSIGEFRIVTEGGKAEYGRSAGGQVEMLTRGGTNNYHGNAFDYFRNTDLNANDYFNNLNGTPTPQFIQNIYGGSFGGPIKHDKTFIFGNFQGRRTHQGVVRNRTVLTPLAKQGIFQFKNAAGAIQQINIAGTDPRGKGIDPTMAGIFALLPDPNNLNAGDVLNSAGFSFNNPVVALEDQFTIKGDQQISKNNKAFLRWSWQRNLSTDNLNNADATFPGQAQGTQGGHRWGYSIGDDWNFGATWANEFRFGHQSALVSFNRPGRIAGPTIISNSFTDPFNSAFAQGRNSPVNEITDNVTKTHDKHIFKWGVDAHYTQLQGTNDGGIFPNVTLSATNNGNVPPLPAALIAGEAGLSATQKTGINSNFSNLYNDVLGRIDAVAQTFLSTDLATFQAPGTTKSRDYLVHEYGYFFQDDWRIRRNLTLNLGLRYEFAGNPQETNGIQAVLNNASLFDGTAPVNTSTITQSSSFYNNDWNNFAPRIGFAWDVKGDGKTSVRGNFGTFYDRTIGATANTVDGNTPGFATSNQVNPQVGAPPAGVPSGDVRISDGIPVVPLPAAPVLTPGLNRTSSVVIINPNLRSGYVNSYSLNVQRELAASTVLEVGYVGNRGIKLFMDQDFNQLNINNGFLAAFNDLNANGNATSLSNPLVAMFNGPAADATCTSSTTKLRAAAAACAIGKIGATNLTNGNVGAAANTIDRSFNFLYPNAGLSQNFLRLYPQYNQLIVGTNSGRSYYDALQVTVRRSTAALRLVSNYTYSHSIDNVSVEGNGFSQAGGGVPIDSFNTRLNRGNGDFDHRHSFNTSISYDLPFGKGHRWGGNMPRVADSLLGGWELGSLILVQDGPVFSVLSQRTTTYSSGTATTFANYSGDRHAGSAQIQPNGTVFFFTPADFANFSFPAAGSIGNTGRNAFRGPGYVNVDQSLVKRFKLTERQALTFRAEAYNLFNHTNYGLGASTNSTFNLNNGVTTFAKLSNTLGSQGQGTSARTMQLTLRYDF